MVARTAEILAQRQQAILAAPAPALHFTLEVNDEPDADALRAAIAAAFPGVTFELTHLLPNDDAPLDRFFRLIVPGLPFAEAGLNGFEVGYDLKDDLGLASVETHAPFEPPLDGGPGDPGLSSGDGNDDPPADRTWSLVHMKVREAWAFSESLGKPSKGHDSIIAQPDTGTADHLMLRGRLKPGWNFFGNNSDTTDPLDYVGTRGHGTSVASNAVGAPIQSLRMVGVAPEAFVRPFRAVQVVIVSPSNSEAIGHSLVMGARMGSQVASMSLGGPYLRSSPPRFLQDCIRHVVGQGLVVVAAAGNIITRLQPPWVTYPGWDPDVICAGNSTPQRTGYEWACRGPEVALSAPGRHVWTAWRGKPEDPVDSVGPGTGTSYATANIAGVAALWFAHHGRETIQRAVPVNRVNALFRHLARLTADRPAGWKPDEYGAGIIDAVRLLKAPLTLPTDAEAEETPRAQPRERLVERLRLLGVDTASLARIDDGFTERYGPELDWIAARRDLREAGVAPLDGKPVSDSLASAFPAALEL